MLITLSSTYIWLTKVDTNPNFQPQWPGSTESIYLRIPPPFTVLSALHLAAQSHVAANAQNLEHEFWRRDAQLAAAELQFKAALAAAPGGEVLSFPEDHPQKLSTHLEPLLAKAGLSRASQQHLSQAVSNMAQEDAAKLVAEFSELFPPPPQKSSGSRSPSSPQSGGLSLSRSSIRPDGGGVGGTREGLGSGEKKGGDLGGGHGGGGGVVGRQRVPERGGMGSGDGVGGWGGVSKEGCGASGLGAERHSLGLGLGGGRARRGGGSGVKGGHGRVRPQRVVARRKFVGGQDAQQLGGTSNPKVELGRGEVRQDIHGEGGSSE